MEKPDSFLSTPIAILLGSTLISVTILIHGGFIKLGQLSPSGNPAPAAAQPGIPAQPQAKTETDIVNNLKSHAKQLSLDMDKFNSCLDSGNKASLVKTDYDEGSKLGVNGTPASFINGRLLSGAVPYDQFKTIIDEELNGNTPTGTTKQTVGIGDLPVLGSQDAKVIVVEFSDYQCPFCGRFFTQTEGLLKKDYIDTGKVKFYYRDFPLSQIHPGAQKAAEAARCAGDQNKYWQYHDLVFQNQLNIF